MITKICLNCGKEFSKGYNESKKYFAIKKYCSRQCYGKAEKGKHHCLSTEFQKGRKESQEIKEKRGKALKGKYVGNKSWMWKGGKIRTSQGRFLIYQLKHPFATSRKYVLLSRLIAEKYLDRYLTTKERIHHINEIIDDDRPENLYLFISSKEHTQYHYLKNPPKLISNLIS